MSAETNAKRSLSRFLHIRLMENMSEMVTEVDDAPVPYEEVCADLAVKVEAEILGCCGWAKVRRSNGWKNVVLNTA